MMGSIAYGTLEVTAWVAVHDGCQIRCTVNPGSGVSVTVAGTNRRRGPGGDDEFEFWFETGVLREFLALGADALAQLDSPTSEHIGDQAGDRPSAPPASPQAGPPMRTQRGPG